MLKSLMIFIFLFLWSVLADSVSCMVFIIYILAITTLLTMSLSEMQIIKKNIIAKTIFHNSTSLFHIVKSVWFTLLVSLLIAFTTSIVLLIQTLYIDSIIFVFLGFDVVFIWMIYNKVKSRLSLSVQDAFLETIARRWTVWINTVLLIIVFVIYQFFTTPTTEVQLISCKILDFLSSSLRYKELIEWKIASSSISSFVGWIFYLLITQSIFAWAYSKLLLSVDISKSIIKTDKNLQNRNYFILGFIGTILLLLISTLIINHLYEKKHIQNMKKLVIDTYTEVDTTIDRQLKSSEKQMLYEIDKIIDNQIETAFSPVYSGVTNLSSYYYSIKGEYTRIALKGHDLYCGYKNGTLVPYYNQILPDGYKLKKCNDKMLDDEIAGRINRYLFVQNSFTMHINRASANIDNSIMQSMKLQQEELKSSISSLENSENISTNEQIKSQLNSVNSKFDEIFQASSRDIAKKSLSGTGAILLTGSLSKTIMSKMLLKLGVKSAGKAATFVAGSATGLTVCAPTGPWALLCGVVTGTASWIGVDAAMTEIDQAFNEKDFQLSITKMIDSEKNTFKALMKISYHKWITKVFHELKESSNHLKSPYKNLNNQ